LELGLRATGHVPTNITEGIFEQSENSYRLKKNMTKIIHAPSYTYRVHTNSWGFRDSITGRRELAGKSFFVFLGESLTFGNGVDYERSFVGIFARKAKDHHIEVLNMAVGGHHFREQFNILVDFIESTLLEPTKVIVCFSPMFISNFDADHKNIIVKNGYLFQRRNWFVPYLKVTFSNTLASYCFFRDGIRQFQAKLSRHTPANVHRIFSLYHKSSNRFSTPGDIERLEATLDELESYVWALSATPVYVYLPLSTDFIIEEIIEKSGGNPKEYDAFIYLNILKEHCKKKMIQLIDATPVLRQHYEKGKRLSFSMDAHYAESANEIIGECIYQNIFFPDSGSTF
ncbi:MAG: hypothetical protein QW279_13025, partial [Candidatus Jordarchaeaceae archaeon]